MNRLTSLVLKTAVLTIATCGVAFYGVKKNYLEASSHREAPLIAEDPVADNTDVYAFRSPDDPNTVTILADYIPLENPQDGPNYHTFGENVRYEVHIKNNATTKGDDVTYRFTFTQTNEDPTTFFNIRLGKQNLKTTYLCEKSVNGGAFTSIVTGGVVPPNNIGPRSIENPDVGLGKYYEQLMKASIMTASSGEKIFCGPVDDPFFVDLGGIFDLGGVRPGRALDGVACKNTHTIALQIPINMLQKNGQPVSQAKNILDGDYVIGVWASSSRPRIKTLNNEGAKPTVSGDWVQISRLGMPLTNEVIEPIGRKDQYNFHTPYNENPGLDSALSNPELGLYMDDSKFGLYVPGFYPLRIQRASQTVLGPVDFGYGRDGLFPILGNPATIGTALDPAIFGNILLKKGQPRSVDILPIFFTGVPNLAPYQLATGKTPGNPLTAGKPFVNNFLPTLGDMLRLNMATPVTDRHSAAFSSEGLFAAAVSGLTDPQYANTSMQFIPNMDGFPNGRRLEDDVVRIELQAVSGLALAAIGIWYDDWAPGKSPLTPKLLNVVGFTTGVEKNDKPLQDVFPFAAQPHRGTSACGGYSPGKAPDSLGLAMQPAQQSALRLSAPQGFLSQNYPNPFTSATTFTYHLASKAHVTLAVYDLNGKLIKVLVDDTRDAGDYEQTFNPGSLATGTYFGSLKVDGQAVQSVKMNYAK